MIKFQENKKYYLRGSIIFLVVVFAFLWNGPITESTGNLSEFASKSIKNIKNVFNDDTRSVDSSPFSQFNIFYKPNLKLVLNDYIKEASIKYSKESESSDDFYSEEEYKYYAPHIVPSKTLTPSASTAILPDVYFFMSIIKILVKIFIFVGILCILFCRSYKSKINSEYLTLNIVSFILLGLIIARINYSCSLCLFRFFSR
jgi:hypothetical protein